MCRFNVKLFGMTEICILKTGSTRAHMLKSLFERIEDIVLYAGLGGAQRINYAPKSLDKLTGKPGWIQLVQIWLPPMILWTICVCY
jgi:hypothetical protein